MKLYLYITYMYMTCERVGVCIGSLFVYVLYMTCVYIYVYVNVLCYICKCVIVSLYICFVTEIFI